MRNRINRTNVRHVELVLPGLKARLRVSRAPRKARRQLVRLGKRVSVWKDRVVVWDAGDNWED